MHQPWALGGAALMILCSSIGSVTAEEKKPTNAIRVVEATYGGNCAGVAKGMSLRGWARGTGRAGRRTG